MKYLHQAIRDGKQALGFPSGQVYFVIINQKNFFVDPRDMAIS